MGVAHDCRRLFWCCATLVLAVSACSPGDNSMIPPTGKPRAEALVRAYSDYAGAPGRVLDDRGEVSYGDTGLSYSAPDEAIIGRAYVTAARTKDAPGERLESYRRMIATLNNPAIGGKYDQGGGYFLLDETKGAYYLVRRFPVAQTTPESLIEGMDRMHKVAARWTTTWFFEVAMMMHGNRPPPRVFVPMPVD